MQTAIAVGFIVTIVVVAAVILAAVRIIKWAKQRSRDRQAREALRDQ